MDLWQSFKIAFSMYSVIPLRNIEWKEETMRYAFCFFPLIGVVIGGAEWLWLWCAWKFGFSAVLTGAAAAVIPVLLTGGIHLDGFCDTVDALSSHQPKERKLEILKDSHVGAFAVIGICVYFLLSFGLWCEYQYSVESAFILGGGFVLSRALSGLVSVLAPQARKEGMLKTFSDAAKQRAVTVSCVAFLGIAAVGMLAVDWRIALAVLAVMATILGYYLLTSRRQFGGVTGDLAGYFLTLAEMGVLAGVVLAQHW
ncbi:adenosylcobinamide-GDP ribazoletransferase [Massilimaliae timonensis]|uniref:Adenosylcobinamide-GDP ribazoletransferase n=1 Tax=Massiliimalia timonensis TaxID=1987501 RepID=A0A8J6P682_9FIRM|nr:adenosylcobinamide-GDP ribazoletransferase [Massiliimalia timonensis]MBC8611763.1 adenosylcobinamide-GDP ribazoletransferase [Massiliimalia timonensis]